MEVSVLFILLSSIFLLTESTDTNWQAVKCSPEAPEIRLPFPVHSGFQLLCKENKPTIHFSSYGDLVVKSISYDTKELSLVDPKNCVPEVFLNLNLSNTPFRYYYVVKNYTYLNCSNRLSSSSFVEVPCLSGSGHHVYVVGSFQAVPATDSCEPVKTVAIPFSYSPYLSDDSFGLGLTWDLTGRGGFELKAGCLLESWLVRCFNGAHWKVLGIFIFIFAVAILIGVKAYCSKDYWVEKLLGNCETLKRAKGSAGVNMKEIRINPIRIALGLGNYGSGDHFKERMFLNEEDHVYLFETTTIDRKAFGGSDYVI